MDTSSFGGKILSFFLSILAAITGAFAPLTYFIAQSNFDKAASFDTVVYEQQLVPTENADGSFSFTTDRDFKILQLTDIHIGGGFMSKKKDAMALNCVAAMVTAEKPDLVIITGDLAYPVPFQAGTFNNEVGAKMIIALMEKLGVYWTVSLGNHDSELYSSHDREYIADIYGSDELKYCLFNKGPADVDGFGNQIIKVENSNGVVTQCFFVLDSHSYVDGDYLGIAWKYDNLHENQIEWYKQNVLAIDAENKEILGDDCEMFSSLAFYHIPSEEYQIAWNEYVANNNQDTENVKYFYGTMGDSGVYPGIYPDNFFETVLELGSTKGIFCGHDHKNNFSLEYKGVRLSYGYSVDYLAYPGIYKQGAQRGCTVITAKADGGFESVLENYYQDKYVSKYEKETVTMD